MYLLIGSPDDPCCRSVQAALQERGERVRTTINPLGPSTRLAWRFDTERSASRITWDDGASVSDGEIVGVLVRGTGWVDPTGWGPDDLAYVQAEMQAALLAWLWSLPCPVVNRPPPSQWYRPHAPLLSWYPLLEHCGLPTAEAVLTNTDTGVRAFEERLTARGIDGVVYGPLTSSARYLVADADGWGGLATLQRYVPVHLAPPHGGPQLACVVGDRVVWAGPQSAEAASLEPALRRFADAAALPFCEVALAPVAGRLCVVAVEPVPRLERFGDTSQREIVAGLVELLTYSPQTTGTL